MCQHLPSGLEIFLFVSGTSKKNLVHGALMEVEILTSPLPHVFSQLGPVFGALALCPQLCQHLPGDLEMFLYVSGTSKKSLVHGALIEAELLTSLSPIYVHNLAWFWVLALCQQVCQHLPSSLQMFLYLSGTIKKCLVHGALIEAGILTSTYPMYLLNLAWFMCTSAPPMDVSTPPKWSRNVPMCLRNFQIKCSMEP